jgi:haloalkane dehalogenase
MTTLTSTQIHINDLGLDGFIVMGQDWGGPIGMAVAAQRAERVAGLVFMNTWFWRTDRLTMRLFSRVMASRPLQRRILERNFFVERILPRSVSHPLEAAELEHYRRAQPTPEARRGWRSSPARSWRPADGWSGWPARRPGRCTASRWCWCGG